MDTRKEFSKRQWKKPSRNGWRNMSENQKSQSDPETLGKIQLVPSIKEIKATLNENRKNLEKLQEQILETIHKIEQSRPDFAGLMAQTALAYDYLRVLYVYSDSLFAIFERQIDWDNRVAQRFEGTKGDYERFKKELPTNLGELVQKGFDTLAQKTRREAEKNTGTYVS